MLIQILHNNVEDIQSSTMTEMNLWRFESTLCTIEEQYPTDSVKINQTSINDWLFL